MAYQLEVLSVQEKEQVSLAQIGLSYGCAEKVMSVTTTYSESGGYERSLDLGVKPIIPSKLIRLMGGIAPVDDIDIAGMRGDLMIGMGLVGDPTGLHLAKRHSAAWPKYWEHLRAETKLLLDYLVVVPPRPDSRYEDWGSDRYKSLNKAVGSISNKAVRNRLFERINCGEDITGIPHITERGIELPATPLTIVKSRSGLDRFHRTESLSVNEDGTPRVEEVNVTIDDVANALICRGNNQPIILWETVKQRPKGIKPVIKWDSEMQFLLQKPIDEILDTGNGQYTLTHSSLVGALILAKLTPEVTSKWPRNRGYSESATTRQQMGPLQATLLTLISLDKIMQGEFIDQLESKLK